jgi:hypothetical protein
MPPSVPYQSPSASPVTHINTDAEPKEARPKYAAATGGATDHGEGNQRAAAGAVVSANSWGSPAYNPAATPLGGAYGNMGGLGGGYGSMLGGGAGLLGGGFGSLLGSPYGGGYGGMPSGPFSGLNQFLFGVQNLVFSLSQAVQIVGMNTHAIQQLLESATAMFDHAVATWQEMQVVEASNIARETEEMKKRRRRLRALRWALVTAFTYSGYKLIRYLLCSRQRQLLEQQRLLPQPMLYGGPHAGTEAYNAPMQPYYGPATPYRPDPSYGGNPYYSGQGY